MIEYPEDIKVGDKVWMWFDYAAPKLGKKPTEHEFVVSFVDGHRMLKLTSTEGGYDIVFTNELIGHWYGGIRRVG